MRIEISTASTSFSFGFVWHNNISNENRVGLILGCIFINIYWGKVEEKTPVA